jgi:RIO kinase 1
MESIGDDKPSPQLKEAVPKDMKEFASLIFKSIKGLADAELVHGDLSEFNILNHNEKPYFIDFSQSTSIRDPYALQYLRRDIESLARFFKKHKYEIDIEKEYSLIAKMIEKKNS